MTLVDLELRLSLRFDILQTQHDICGLLRVLSVITTQIMDSKLLLLKFE